ncbi:interleukin-15 receptor subunit alpha [Guaruba guarouba]
MQCGRASNALRVSSPRHRLPPPLPSTASTPGSCILPRELHPSPRVPSPARGTASHLPKFPIPAGRSVPPRRIGAKAKAKGEGGSGHAGYVRRRRRAAGTRRGAPAGALSPPARRRCRCRRRPMERPLLPLLYGTVAFLLSCAAADTVPMRCSRPKDVANAHIDVGNNTLLNTRLRYTCNPGYKRKAGTSSLIQCILRDDSSEPDWTHTTLQCIRDPALPPETPSPELLTVSHTERMTPRGTTETSPTSSPSPAATPVPPAPDGTSSETLPPLQISTLGEETAPGSSLGTTTLPDTPREHAAVSIQTLASSIGLSVLLVAGIVACCCWRMRMCTRQSYAAAVTAIPMVPAASENEEMLPPSVYPTG